MNPFILLFLALCARYPETMKVIISLVFLYFLIYSIGGWGFFLIILLSVVFIVIVKIVGTVWNSDDKNNDYKNRISGRNQSIAHVMRNDPDVTVRKGDEASGILPAYSGDTRSPIPVISVHSVGNLQYLRQS